MRSVLVICLLVALVRAESDEELLATLHGRSIVKGEDKKNAFFDWVKVMTKMETEYTKNRFHETFDRLKKGRSDIDQVFDKLLVEIVPDDQERHEVIDNRYTPIAEKMNCYTDLLDAFNNQCINIYNNGYIVAHEYTIYNLCHIDDTAEEELKHRALDAFKNQQICNAKSLAIDNVD